jgi:hypothetical protein
MDPTSPPKVSTTTSNSQEYAHRLASISSRASLSEPLNILFQLDKLGPSTNLTLENLYQYTLSRINQKIKSGSVIIEANDFVAVACLEPPESVAADLSGEELREMEEKRPVYAKYNRQLEKFRREALGYVFHYPKSPCPQNLSKTPTP